MGILSLTMAILAAGSKKTVQEIDSKYLDAASTFSVFESSISSESGMTHWQVCQHAKPLNTLTLSIPRPAASFEDPPRSSFDCLNSLVSLKKISTMVSLNPTNYSDGENSQQMNVRMISP